MRVAALTGGAATPSARFRIRQHIEPLRSRGIEVLEYVPAIGKNASLPESVQSKGLLTSLAMRGWTSMKYASRVPGILKSYAADAVWLNKGMIDGRYTLERIITRPIVLDVDDAIWLSTPNGEEAVGKLARKSSAIIAGNDHLAEWFSKHSRNVHVIPTAVDTDRFVPGQADSDRPFTLGWIGSSVNFKYLYSLETVFAEVLRDIPAAALLVCADKPPTFKSLPGGRIKFIKWSPDVEVSAIQNMTVGLMPLDDSPWARGKCAYKMLQYLSCGIPVIASPVGVNREVLAMGDVGLSASTDEEWIEAIREIAKHADFGRKLGQYGRELILRNFSAKLVEDKIAAVFFSLNR